MLGEMLIDGEPMYVWSRSAMTGRNDIEIRRYAYEPEEFLQREAGITAPLTPTRKRDQR